MIVGGEKFISQCDISKRTLGNKASAMSSGEIKFQDEVEPEIFLTKLATDWRFSTHHFRQDDGMASLLSRKSKIEEAVRHESRLGSSQDQHR